MKPTDKKIYLASKSPRRRELLRQVGVEFELLSLRSDPGRGPDVSEDEHPGEAPLAVRQKILEAALATLKSKEVIDAYAAVGGVAVGSTPEDLAKFLAGEGQKWGEVCKYANVKLE